jgi:hypothetical protein
MNYKNPDSNDESGFICLSSNSYLLIFKLSNTDNSSRLKLKST